MEDPQVTIIIATYNRPDVLKFAIESVLSQTIANWKLLIIGDNCTKSTGDLIKQFNDPRIDYINLPQRFGEQSGPNSIGLKLSKTPYIAYLNHDDVWLPDHLEQGIEVLSHEQYQFYIGGTAFTSFGREIQDGFEVFIDEHNIGYRRTPHSFYLQRIRHYEPVSSWIFTSDVAKSVGQWNYYNTIYRPPIDDFLLRTWQLGFKFYFAQTITVWHVLLHYRNTNAYLYQNSASGYDFIGLLAGSSGDKIRETLDNKHAEWKTLSANEKNVLRANFEIKYNRPWWKKLRLRIFKIALMNHLAAYAYRYLKVDLFVIACSILPIQKGFMIQKVLEKRADVIKARPNLSDVLKRVQE